MKKNSPIAPFKSKDYTVIWSATVISTIGLRMHEIGAGWLMTTMTDDPFIVALVQAATSLPIFLFVLFAGAIADVVSKRGMLVLVNIIMAIIAAVLALLVSLDLMTPYLLIIFIFLIGTCAAFTTPPKQAINPMLVPKEDLQSAIAMNSIGFNISRSIGPAIAGILIVTLGPESPFIFNALSFIVIIWAFLWWCPKKANRPLPKEPIFGAIKAGLRYARYSKPLRATLWRAFAFFISASSFWALLPIFVKIEVQGGADLFGFLIGAIGLGAVIGAFLSPIVKKWFNSDQLTWISAIMIASILLLSAYPVNNILLTYLFPTWPIDEILLIIGCTVFGISWIWTLSTFSVSAQSALPDWVRARGLAIYLMVFFGSMSAGSIFWGAVASKMGIKNALIIASSTLLLGAILTRKQKLNLGKNIDFSPSKHWAEPKLSASSDQDRALLNERSPVMVMIEYEIEPSDVEIFLSLMNKLSESRRQYGAYGWEVLQQSDKPDTFVECFFDASWLDHLRHRERLTGKDHLIEQQVYELHKGEMPPQIKHFLGQQKPV